MKRSFLYTAAFILILGLFFVFPSAYAQDKTELQDQIDALEEEIARYQQQINAIAKEGNTLKNTITQLNLTAQKLEADIKVTERQIKKAQSEIGSLGNQIIEKGETINIHQQALASTMRDLYVRDTSPLTVVLSGSDSLSVVVGELDAYKTLKEKFKTEASSLRHTRIDLEVSKTKTETHKKELEKLKSKLLDERSILKESQKEKDALLRQTANQEENYKKILADRLLKKAQFETELREFEAKLTTKFDANSIPRAGTRVFSWPLADVFITQQFGATVDSKRLYASGTHSGVDFRASTGTPVLAPADGVVTGVGNTDITCPRASFGNWILISYDNGLASAFGHLSLIKVKKGDMVVRGQVVGYSGNTGYSTAPHLHMTVYAGKAVTVTGKPSQACSGKTYIMPVAPPDAYLDPLSYLPKAAASQFKTR
jgi:murein DD-endopeptidase MepM/ murein hydrolase activator NlpD